MRGCISRKQGSQSWFFEGWKTIHCLWFCGLKILHLIGHNRVITGWDSTLHVASFIWLAWQFIYKCFVLVVTCNVKIGHFVLENWPNSHYGSVGFESGNLKIKKRLSHRTPCRTSHNPAICLWLPQITCMTWAHPNPHHCARDMPVCYFSYKLCICCS